MLPPASHQPHTINVFSYKYPPVPQRSTLPCRDVVLAPRKTVPVLLDQTEGLPATLAEHYASTSKEVQNKLRENVSAFVEFQIETTTAVSSI